VNSSTYKADKQRDTSAKLTNTNSATPLPPSPYVYVCTCLFHHPYIATLVVSSSFSPTFFYFPFFFCYITALHVAASVGSLHASKVHDILSRARVRARALSLSLARALSLYRERELFKEFKDFSYLRCKCFIKNKKIKNLLHTRAPPLPPPLNALNINM
jgi:hypothetical protein